MLRTILVSFVTDTVVLSVNGKSGCYQQNGLIVESFSHNVDRLSNRRHKAIPLVVNVLRMRYSINRVSGKVNSLDIPLLFSFCM